MLYILMREYSHGLCEVYYFFFEIMTMRPQSFVGYANNFPCDILIGNALPAIHTFRHSVLFLEPSIWLVEFLTIL